MSRHLLVGIVLSLGLSALSGCGSAEVAAVPGQQTQTPEALFESIMASLREERPTVATYQNAVQQLNSYLERLEGVRAQVTPHAQQRDLVRTELLKGLDAVHRQQRLTELDRLSFTEHDSYHLDASLLFRDAAVTIKSYVGIDPGRPLKAEEKLPLAVQAFRWVIRQVALKTPKVPGDPWPAHEALRRGTGTEKDHDRARIFLTLLAQLGLDGCMVTRVVEQSNDQGQKEIRELPWMPGVLVGGEVYLFETGLGIPIPTPGGQGVATLKQVRSDASILKALGKPDTPYEVTPVQLEKASLLLASSLPELSPRMRWLQGRMEDARNPVILYQDLAASLKRFRDANLGAESRLWTSLTGYPTIVLPRYVENPLRQRRWANNPDIVPRDLADPWVHEFTAKLLNQGQQFFTYFDAMFLRLRLEPGGVRDLLVRGRPEMAMDRIIQYEVRLDRSLEDYRSVFTNPEPHLRKDWAVRMERADQELQTLLARRPAGNAPPGQGDEAVQDMFRRIDGLWKEQQLPLQVISNTWAAPELYAHLAYFMGLAKMELAVRNEQAAVRASGPAAAQHWDEAAYAWDSAANWFLRYRVIAVQRGRDYWGQAAEDHLHASRARVEECRKAQAEAKKS